MIQLKLHLSRSLWRNLITSMALFVLIFAGTEVFGQGTTTVTLTWSGGWCNICPPPNNVNNYSCTNPGTSGFVNWNNGVRTFVDPVPAGNIVTSVSVEVQKHNCGYNNMNVELNTTAIGGSLAPGFNTCSCSTSPCGTQTWSDTWACPAGIPNYVYGGTNTLQLFVNGWTACVKHAAVTLTYEVCCPTPAPPGPISGPLSVCQGDTVTYSVPSVPGALTYTWTTDTIDTVVSGQGTTSLTIVIDSNGSDSVCVNLSDTCTNSNDTCIVYTIIAPSAPGVVTGDTVVCEGDTALYSISSVPGAINYTWSGPPGSVVVSGQGTISAQIQFGATSGNVCVTLTDSCATSPPSCLNVNVNLAPTPSNAGGDQTLCSGLSTMLNGNTPGIGTGEWSLQSGGGTINDIADPNSNLSNVQVGVNVFTWTITSPGCPPSADDVTIFASQSPTAEFDATSICFGNQTDFVDQSNGNGFPLVSWGWDINGDNFTDYTSQNPSHTYPAPGNNSVRLIVSNAFGCSDTITHAVKVNPNPVAAFTVPDVCHNDPSQFTDGSTISGGNITSWYWSFGDNTFNSLSNPGHTYGVPGNYPVNLIVTSDSGCSDTANNIAIIHHNPVVSFSDNGNCLDQTVDFVDNSTVTGATIIDWEWNFGDNTPFDLQQNPSHDYTVPNSYSVTLNVESSDGCIGSLTKPVEINPVPVANFTYTNNICLGDLAEFIDVSTISGGSTITTWDWQFGDNITSGLQNPGHTYSNHDEYNVWLTVTSDDNCSNSIKKTVQVFPLPDANFEFQDACEEDWLTITDISTIPVGDITFWEWDFGDGNPKIQGTQSMEYLYHDPVPHTITLKVKSDRGCVATAQDIIEIFEKPDVAFNIEPDTGCAPLTVELSNQTTINNSAINLQYKWVFGDGTTSDEFEPTHVYANSGERKETFDISLIVETDQGCIAKEEKEDSILVYPQPIARYELSPERTDVLEPLVKFTDRSKGGSYWIWDFGDGHSEEGHRNTVSHAYATSGIFITTITTENFYGCRDEASIELIVDPKTTLYIPTAFTPNGDGDNDYFFAKGIDADREFVLRVFDRWGNTLFKGNGIDAKWDGRDPRGEIVQQGVYVFRIDYMDGNGEKQEVVGNVTLVGGQDR